MGTHDHSHSLSSDGFTLHSHSSVPSFNETKDPIAEKLHTHIEEVNEKHGLFVKNRTELAWVHGAMDRANLVPPSHPDRHYDNDTTFNISDAVVKYNGAVLRSVLEVKYSQGFDPPSIMGELVVYLFAGDRFSEVVAQSRTYGDNVLTFELLNEYGGQRTIRFNGVTFHKRVGEYTGHHVAISDIYHFTAQSLEG